MKITQNFGKISNNRIYIHTKCFKVKFSFKIESHKVEMSVNCNTKHKREVQDQVTRRGERVLRAGFGDKGVL